METQILNQPKIKIPSYRRRYIIELNDSQLWQYELLIKGLGVLPDNEIKKLDHKEKRSIIYRHEATWKIINRLKQEKMNNLLAKIINKLVPNISGNAIGLLLDPLTDNQFTVLPSLKECNVSQEQIIHALINHKILPTNFLK